MVQPRVCLRNREVCSRSNRRRKACQARSMSGPAAAGSLVPAQRFRGAVAGQMVDLQPDQGALDDRQWARMLAPRAAVF
jgi:hypothetical protein